MAARLFSPTTYEPRADSIDQRKPAILRPLADARRRSILYAGALDGAGADLPGRQFAQRAAILAAIPRDGPNHHARLGLLPVQSADDSCAVPAAAQLDPERGVRRRYYLFHAVYLLQPRPQSRRPRPVLSALFSAARQRIDPPAPGREPADRHGHRGALYHRLPPRAGRPRQWPPAARRA